MQWSALPAQAAWRHSGARDGFEVLLTDADGDGRTLSGHTTAVEDGVAWSVDYVIATDRMWRTITVEATSHTMGRRIASRLRRSKDNRWFVDGVHRPDLDGCIDADFESSAVTNTLPVHRLDFPIGQELSVPAAFVHAGDLGVRRLEQTYTRLDDTSRFAYCPRPSSLPVNCTSTDPG